MIHYLDETIKALLIRDLPALFGGDSPQVRISFAFNNGSSSASPLPGDLPAINFFLYDLRENRDLRSNEWVERRSNGAVTRQRSPIRVDCAYLVTYWRATESEPAEEHQYLGEVMRVLLRYPTLPADVLHSKLQPAQDLPLPTTALQPTGLQSLGEFWQALGGRPLTVLNYTVTISVDPFEAVEYPVVTEKVIGVRPGSEMPENDRLHKHLLVKPG